MVLLVVAGGIIVGMAIAYMLGEYHMRSRTLVSRVDCKTCGSRATCVPRMDTMVGGLVWDCSECRSSQMDGDDRKRTLVPR